MTNKYSNRQAFAEDIDHAYFTVVGVLITAIAGSTPPALLAVFATVAVRTFLREYESRKRAKTFIGGVDQEGKQVDCG